MAEIQLYAPMAGTQLSSSMVQPQNPNCLVGPQLLNTMVGTQLLNIMVGPQLLHTMTGTQLPRFFQNLPNSQPISSGHDVINTPVPFSVWGFIMTMVIVISFVHERKLHQLTTHLTS